jgi:hypothetical protein
VIYPYNKSQRDFTISQVYSDEELYMLGPVAQSVQRLSYGLDDPGIESTALSETDEMEDISNAATEKERGALSHNHRHCKAGDTLS